ncbi:MAG: ribosome-associated translation inhibitor RaiA [Dehalococcoidia bacterium]|nr:ribosome-associated translation inhibitor RaiA [Dehalococcoidia bacterium]
MEIILTGKNLEVTSRMKDYVEKKLLSLQRHFKSVPALVLHVVLTEEKTKSAEKRFVVEFTTNVKDSVLRSEERGPDLHVAVDRAAEVMDHQIERFKGRIESRRRQPAPTDASAQTIDQDSIEGEVPSRVVKVKRHAVKPMSTDEAIDQMDMLGHDFFLFFNRSSEELNVVYRRRSGDYGLIEVQAE